MVLQGVLLLVSEPCIIMIYVREEYTIEGDWMRRFKEILPLHKINMLFFDPTYPMFFKTGAKFIFFPYFNLFHLH